MATDLADIDKVMKRIAKNLPKVIDRETRRIATEIGEAAIDATPVKSGNLVNNWGITDGRPNPYDPRAKGNRETAKNRFANDLNRIGDVSTLQISNTTPYARKAIPRGRVAGATREAAKKAYRKMYKNMWDKLLRGS